LLIAFGAPIAVGLVVWAVGLPFVGIATLVGKVRERRQAGYSGETWRHNYELADQEERETIPLTEKTERAELFIADILDEGISTRAELNERGKGFGYSEATIGRALNILLEAGEIERIARGVYSKVSSIPEEELMPEKVTQPQVGDAEGIAAMMLEIEKQRKKQSNTFGVWSLVLGIIGIPTFFVPVSAVAAIALGALQFRRHVSKCSIAGLVLGIIGVALFVILIEWLSYEVPYAVPV